MTHDVNHLIGTLLASLPMAKTAKQFLDQLQRYPTSASISDNNYMVLRFVDQDKRAVVEIDHDGDAILYLKEANETTTQHYVDAAKLAQAVLAYLQK